MTDRQLTGLVAVVERGSFSAAAEALYISQSALSQQIAQLEQQLGFPLFDRGRRKVVLTEGGKAFYEKARRILALYRTGTEEGRYLDQLRKQQMRRLVIGCEKEQFLQIWMDLFHVTTEEISDHFAPQPVRYDSRERLYAALLQGEADLAVQLENPELERCGLRTIPFARTEELCLFPPGMDRGRPGEKDRFTPEELSHHAIAFHNPLDGSSYENKLRHYFAERFPQTRVLNPADFFTAPYTQTVLLVPAIQHTAHHPQYVGTLDWQGGARVCFVTSPNCDGRIIEYAMYLKDHITAQICPWYLPLEIGE